MRTVFTLLFALLVSAADAAESARAFWVWHRNAPLTAEEEAELERQSVRTLYWNVGTLEQRGMEWRWKVAPLEVDALATKCVIVPVVRIDPEVANPFAPTALKDLLAKLKPVARNGAVQLDYDCVDRRLGQYAAALAELRRELPGLSITALGYWPRLADFPALEKSVSALMPMFYDLQADPTGISADAPPPPLLDPDQVAAFLRDWKKCKTPWFAGLPTFSRLTVFDAQGHSRGQIPNWAWDDFCFHENLHTLAPTRLGVTLLRSAVETRVASTPVRAGEIVISRFADRGAIARAVVLAGEAGASGVTFFRLPDGTDPAGWSLCDLAQAEAGKPRLTLRRGDGEWLELVNDSPHDLAPRLSGARHDRDRGYCVEIDAKSAVFREALPGDFWRRAAHIDPDSDKPTAVSVQLGTRLTFWFSHLRAGARLKTGLLQLAPAATLDEVRYRIPQAEEHTAWKPIESR